ncbi:MAG: hypothetical protein ABWK01_08255 [Infirmifilum sp.]
MPWIGLESSCVTRDLEDYLKGYGYTILRTFEIELLVKDVWRKFTVYEVVGFAEGVAEILAETFNCPAIEAGPHLILGEVSAKLWDEAVKVVMPSGESFTIPVYTYDGFLDIKMPTSKVRGLKGEIIIAGKTFSLPLTENDFHELMIMDRRIKEKIEKAISVYGVKKILSEDFLGKIKESGTGEGIKSGRLMYEIDDSTKMVLCLYEGKLTSMNLQRFAIFLVEKELFDELREFSKKLVPADRKIVLKALQEYFELYENSIKHRDRLKNIMEELEKNVEK